MTAIIDLLLVLLTSFGFNLIPFAGPSNLLIASNAAILLGTSDPLVLVAVGFLVAFGASFAKGLHYIITFFVGKHLKGKQRERLDADAVKLKRWAFWLLFAAAATPIPDEPIVIPLGLMKYSPAKFFTAFFLGKLSITIVGAFLGAWGGKALSEWLSPELTVVLSIVLTVVVTVILLKVDVGKLAEKYLRRKPKRQPQAAEGNN
jgi:membrane protein DedA with SNARE-associated domain